MRKTLFSGVALAAVIASGARLGLMYWSVSVFL